MAGAGGVLEDGEGAFVGPFGGGEEGEGFKEGVEHGAVFADLGEKTSPERALLGGRRGRGAVDVVMEEGAEAFGDGAGGEGAVFEAGDGGDAGGGAEDEEFGLVFEVGGTEFLGADGEAVVPGEVGDALEGGAGEMVVGGRDEEGAAGGDGHEVFGVAFGDKAVGVDADDEVGVAGGGFGFHEDVGEVVAGFDGGESAGFGGDGAEDGAGAFGVAFHEGRRGGVGDGVKAGGGGFGGVDAETAGAAAEEEADEKAGAGGEGAEVGEDVAEAVWGDGEGEADAGGGVVEAGEVGVEVVKLIGFEQEGFEDAVAAVDEVVVDGDAHEAGIGDEGIPFGGVHGVVGSGMRGCGPGGEAFEGLFEGEVRGIHGVGGAWRTR